MKNPIRAFVALVTCLSLAIILMDRPISWRPHDETGGTYRAISAGISAPEDFNGVKFLHNPVLQVVPGKNHWEVKFNDDFQEISPQANKKLPAKYLGTFVFVFPKGTTVRPDTILGYAAPKVKTHPATDGTVRFDVPIYDNTESGDILNFVLPAQISGHPSLSTDHRRLFFMLPDPTQGEKFYPIGAKDSNDGRSIVIMLADSDDYTYQSVSPPGDVESRGATAYTLTSERGFLFLFMDIQDERLKYLLTLNQQVLFLTLGFLLAEASAATARRHERGEEKVAKRKLFLARRARAAFLRVIRKSSRLFKSKK